MFSLNPLATSYKNMSIPVLPKGSTEKEEATVPAQKVSSRQSSKRDLELRATVVERKVLQIFKDTLFPSDIYWDALLKVGKGKIEEAKEIIQSAKIDSPPNRSFAWLDFKPENIESFFDKLFIDYLRGKSQVINQLGLLESIGVSLHNKRLNNCSVAGKQRDLELANENLKTLESYDYNTLTPEQQASYKIFKWLLQHEVDGERFLYHEYPITQVCGVLNDLLETFAQFHKIDTEKDFSVYKTRLGEIPKQFKEVKDLMKMQWSKGIRLPKFALEGVIAAILSFVKLPTDENPFYAFCVKQLEKFPGEKISRLKELKRILNHDVLPAYEELLLFFFKQYREASTNHNVGNEYYAYCLKQYTTTDFSPEKIHMIGLIEVNNIQKEIRKVLNSVWISDEKIGVAELMNIYGFIPIYGVETLKIHVVNSQHRFQLALPAANGIPLMRQYREFRAFENGWELYRERLAYEEGEFKAAEMKLSFLRHELLHSARLIVDTGIHMKGWSKDIAIACLQDLTGFDKEFAVREVEGIVVSPGKACSYKIGQQKFLQMRQKYMDAPGKKRTLKDFHDAVMKVGPAPLTVLEQLII